MDIANISIKKRTSLWVIIVLILIGSYISYEKLGRFEDPEFIIRQAVINTPYPGASAANVSDTVTNEIQAAVQSMQEIDEIKSVSRHGMSEVTVEVSLSFSKTRDALEQVWDKLRRKVSDAQYKLPRGAGPSIVNDDFSDVYALFYAITGPGYTDKQLQDYTEFLKKELALVDGVAKTATLGEKAERIYIEIASERLVTLGVSAEHVYRTLEKQNSITVAGEIKAGSMNLAVIPESPVSNFDDLKSLPLGIGGDGQTLKLSDVANVYRGYKEPASLLMTYNGERAIGFGISNTTGGNVVEMGKRVQQRLTELESQRPVGVELNPISLQSESVEASVDSFIDNLIAAIAIVLVVLLIFMGVRSGIIIGFVLLLTVAATLILMLMDNIAMQRISLGALIIALGMLVDNAIVVTDGVLTRLKNGEDRKKAISKVVKSTQWPLLGGTVVGILAFSAIGLSPSDMGEYAGSLFWVILYSMMLSWLFSITVTPLLCYQFLRVKTDEKPKKSAILDGYKTLLLLALKNRKAMGLALVLLLVGGVFAAKEVPPGFMPESQRAQFVVDIYLPQGTHIDKTAAVVDDIRTEVAQKSSVTNVTSFIGGGGLRFMLTYSPEPRNTSYGQLLVDVDNYESITSLVTDLQSELTRLYPDASIKVWKFMLGRGGGKKIEAGFSGPNPDTLRELSEKAKAIMNDNDNLIAVQDDWRQRVPVIAPTYDNQLMQQLGLTTVELNQAVAQLFTGRTIGQYREQDDLIPLVVRAPIEERNQQRAMEGVEVYSDKLQANVPLTELINKMNVSWQDAMIRQIDRQPTILVQADPAPGVLTNKAFEEVQPRIEAIKLPPGYDLTWYGEYKASKDANAGLASSAPYGFAAMILAVVFMFNALRQPLVIWLTVPFAIVGVVAGLIIFQTPFEFMAILGFLSLVGMMVKNAIVLVDQADVEIASGKEPFKAVIEASISRAKPVVLGALTTILGVAPLLLDPFFKSMAVTIMFGLLFATALTLIVIPLLYVSVLGIQYEESTDSS